ncbi:DNA repair protein complementing XP-C cells homolog [Actinia tenebrosa]|uniref:DNA repair protein complementing XP-C cells homolog n=1 Tax=Actinia tenebrosa TaxID=6105 RepID=A0A6P8I209_ACTTE|nr:DNA repair protein complementing XP-C cells homolog [Actinia tenebrosa]
MVRKRITRSIDDLPEVRLAKRKKVEDPCDTTALIAPSKSKRTSSSKGITPARKRKPKSEENAQQNGFASESEDSEVEVAVKKKQRVSRRSNLKNTRQNNEEKPDEVEKTKERKTSKKRGKKKIQKGNEKLCLQKTDDTCIVNTDAIETHCNETPLQDIKMENLGGNAKSGTNKHARGKKGNNPKINKKSLKESAKDIKSKLDDQYDATSRVNDWVKTEKAKDADSSGGESEEDIDWEDVQEAEGHHSVDLCDNSSISSSTACSSAVTKTEVEISIQIPGMKGKRKKKTEDDLLTKIKKAMTRFKKQIQLDMHKAHLVTLIAWGFNRNAVCNQPVLQAYSLSFVPSHLITKSVKKWQSEELTNLITWFKEDFPPFQQFRDDLSKNDMIPVSRYPQNMAEVLVILLRSLGILTRLVASLQPVSMKIAKDGKAATKKANASKIMESPSNSSIQATPTRAGKPSVVLKSENTLDDSEIMETKQANTLENNADSPASSTSTSVQSSSPSSSGQAKVKTSPSSSQSSSSLQSKVESSVKTRSNQNETPRKTKSSTPKVGNKKEKDENKVKDAASGPKRKRLRKQKKVNYADNADSGSNSEDQLSSYSEEKSNSESDEEFEKEISYKAPVKKPAPSKGKTNKTSLTSKVKKSPSVVEMIDDDDEFEISSKPRIFRRQSSQSSKEGKSPVQIISDDSDEGATVRKNKAGTDMWVEVYLPTSKSWMCVDLVSYSVNQPELCEKYASNPLSYVLSFDNENSVKDVTERYASEWLSKTKKFRIDAEWWEETLLPYKTKKKKMDEMENSQLLAQHQERPLPQSITEYKNHPLYVLKRHLLKFEAIYPETAATLGFIRGEAVYSRDCVHLLHTREKWMSLDARVVKQGEEPYKIVKGRMKRNQPVVDLTSTVTIDLFGQWQTEEYKPPPVKDGKVPRNEYGNVELFKPSMLPPGSKHIKIPGIQKIAKKLGIDGAPAVVGFDFHCGFCHPVIDGLVVAKESVPALMDAWRQEQQEAERRKEEKREKRVLGYWKQFVKSLLIRERLKRKYDTQESRTSEQSGEQLEDEKISSVAVSWPQNMKQGKTSIKDEGHCHVFPKRLHKKDKINGEWTKSCTCGFTLPLDK